MMDESSYLRALAKYPKVRNSDFYSPPDKKSKTPLLSSNDTIVTLKRAPITTAERIVLEEKRTLKANSESKQLDGSENKLEQQKITHESDDFFKVFDKWVDSQWPDRLTSTKVKVAFRKEHKRLLVTLNLEEIEEIAEVLSSQ